MKKALILALALCMFAATALASGFQVTPFEEAAGTGQEEELYYLVPLSGTGRSFQMPASANYMMYADEEELKVLLIFPDESELPLLYLFAFYTPDLKGVDVSALKGDDMLQLLARITSYPEDAEPNPMQLAGNIPAVELTETRENEAIFARHMLVICGDWMYNLMLGYPTALNAQPPEELYAVQEMLISRFANDAYQPTYLHAYELPGLDAGWAFPEDKIWMIMTGDEDDFKSMILVDPEEPNRSVFSLWAIHDDAYQGQTIQTLDPQLVQAAIAYWSLGNVEQDSMQGYSNFAGDQPVLSYQEPNAAMTFYYLMGIREGWMLVLQYMDHEEIDTEKYMPMFHEVMQTLMGGQGNP